MESFQPGVSLSTDWRAEISARAEFIVNKSFKCTRTVLFLSDCFLNAAHSLTQVQERQKKIFSGQINQNSFISRLYCFGPGKYFGLA